MRPSRDEWLLEMAALVARRATCARRSVGCVLADARGHVLATGYNGRPRGFDHCSEGHPCSGATAPSGTRLDECEAVHAEANALLQCPDVEAVDTCYVTVSPCVWCVKLLLNTSCRRVVAAAPYPHDEAARDLWRRGGRIWVAADEVAAAAAPARLDQVVRPMVAVPTGPASRRVGRWRLGAFVLLLPANRHRLTFQVRNDATKPMQLWLCAPPRGRRRATGGPAVVAPGSTYAGVFPGDERYVGPVCARWVAGATGGALPLEVVRAEVTP